ncbi:hypothetical protein [Roseiterribacter gracilis]|uniref:Uncharacterized protein n=1 Tax=Roseiterribacter gracilis TaxID=2812848 RepID=A0A8S8X741_9PROT|nr:hypothetical protein TMPK1_03010 [Rhodospirillales bacterium TMPK1]
MRRFPNSARRIGNHERVDIARRPKRKDQPKSDAEKALEEKIRRVSAAFGRYAILALTITALALAVSLRHRPDDIRADLARRSIATLQHAKDLQSFVQRNANAVDGYLRATSTAFQVEQDFLKIAKNRVQHDASDFVTKQHVILASAEPLLFNFRFGIIDLVQKDLEAISLAHIRYAFDLVIDPDDALRRSNISRTAELNWESYWKALQSIGAPLLPADAPRFENFLTTSEVETWRNLRVRHRLANYAASDLLLHCAPYGSIRPGCSLGDLIGVFGSGEREDWKFEVASGLSYDRTTMIILLPAPLAACMMFSTILALRLAQLMSTRTDAVDDTPEHPFVPMQLAWLFKHKAGSDQWLIGIIFCLFLFLVLLAPVIAQFALNTKSVAVIMEQLLRRGDATTSTILISAANIACLFVTAICAARLTVSYVAAVQRTIKDPPPPGTI